MSDIIQGNAKFTKFFLKSSFAPRREMSQKPGGWNDEELEITRHEKWLGKFTQFTDDLTFYNEEAKYVKNAYKLGGINENLFLIKETLRESGDDVKYVNEYTGIADWKTKSETENSITIKFNSDDLEEIIKAHQEDEFEMERLDSIDGVPLDPADIKKIELKGRSLSSFGSSELYSQVENGPGAFQSTVIKNRGYTTAITIVNAEGDSRFTSVDTNEMEQTSYDVQTFIGLAAGNLFYQDVEIDTGTTELTIDYDIDFSFKSYNQFTSGRDISARLLIVEWDDIGEVYFIVEDRPLYQGVTTQTSQFVNIQGTEVATLLFNQGAALVFKDNGNASNLRVTTLNFSKHNIKVNVSSFFEGSQNLSFMFVHDVFKRWMYILTGRKDAFYSKYFGRQTIGYFQNGFGGLIGLISGFWVRAFSPESQLYKSLTISLEDLMKSTVAVFNIGATIENIGNFQRFRVEDAKFFYQPRVVVKLPNIVYNEVEKINPKMLYSGIEIGYDKGGDYENQAGLDEPNTRTNFVTPIRKSKEKYNQISIVRTDETAMEIARRMPEFYFPNEDTNYDLNNWFLDTKPGEIVPDDVEPTGYVQKEWFDRLVELPTGVQSPEDYRAFLFTPLRMLFRHGWMINVGMQPYLNKFIKYLNSKANSTLSTWFIGEANPYAENIDDLAVSELINSKFTETVVTLNHPMSQELLDWINGTTQVEVEGSLENVPNFYFKMQWTNELGETKTGYLDNLKPKESGEFTFQKCNDI